MQFECHYQEIFDLIRMYLIRSQVGTGTGCGMMLNNLKKPCWICRDSEGVFNVQPLLLLVEVPVDIALDST